MKKNTLIFLISFLLFNSLFTLHAEGELEEVAYTYNGEQFRDPFIPLAGGNLSDMLSVKIEVGAFNPTSVNLKGIIKTPVGRWALLKGTSNETYRVRNGKIQDSKRKAVEGYVGIVKEKSLVIIGPNNQVTELKLKKEDGKEGMSRP